MPKQQLTDAKQAVGALLDCVSEVSGYIRPAVLPAIASADEDWSQQMANNNVGASYYDRAWSPDIAGTIIIGEVRTRLQMLQYLAHELVHFTQDWNGRMAADRSPEFQENVIEVEAYKFGPMAAELFLKRYDVLNSALFGEGYPDIKLGSLDWTGALDPEEYQP